jgi:IclR family pca regulon transcriptional regulator
MEHATEISAATGDPNFMSSLARGLAVIRGFSREKRFMTIAQLSHKTGIPRAAVRRCLYTLERLGYVASEDGRNFALRPKLLGLGHAYLSSTPLVVTAQPFLDRVSDAVDESCSLAILEGDDILSVARSLTSRIISVSLNAGSRLPAYCTSIGLVLLAHLPPDELKAYLARADLKRYTDRTITSRAALLEMLDEVRSQDYAVADNMMEIGVRSIAVPVRNAAGTVVAGMNVIIQSGRGTVREMKSLYLPQLQAAARELAAQLVP